MMSDRPSHLIDPVCGITVEVARAEAAGLLVEIDRRTFAFCGAGCRRAFVEAPAEFVHEGDGDIVSTAHGADAHAHGHMEMPVIDEGMRRWYESCSCCLSEAFPEIKAQLDAERAAAALTPVSPGICDVAENPPSA
jgi:YHS domain-containing protein